MNALESLWSVVVPIGSETTTIFARYVPFLMAERFFAADRQQPLRNLWFNLTYTLCYQVGTYLVLPLALTAATVTLLGRWGPVFHVQQLLDAHAGIAVRAVAWLLIFDFFYYWFHRLQHVVPLLWRQHSLHHLDRSVNATTTLRHHWLEEPLRVFFIVVPMSLLTDLTPAGYTFAGSIAGFWAIFIHANLRLHLGPVARVVVGPQCHRVHHSLLVEHRDRNFAAFFSFWDVLFGTYYHPARGEFPPTGVVGEASPTTLLDANLLPFKPSQAVRADPIHPAGSTQPRGMLKRVASLRLISAKSCPRDVAR